jgi:hypothetical protein
MLKVYELSSYVLVRFVLTHPVSQFVFYVLPYLMLGSALVSINLVTPAIKAEWISPSKICIFMQEINLWNLFSSLICIHYYMFATRAKSMNKCGIWTCMFGLNCLLVWYIQPVDCGSVDMGRRKWALKTQLPARCTMLFGRSVVS